MKKFIFFTLWATQISPQIFPFFSDAILLILFFFIFFRNPSVKFIIIFISLSLFGALLFFKNSIEFFRHLLPIFRFFILAYLFRYAFQFKGIKETEVLSWLIWSGVMFCFFNILGIVSVDMYSVINDWWNGEQRFISLGRTVASVASNERLSSIFPQPANAGSIGAIYLVVGMFYVYEKRVYFAGVILMTIGMFVGLLSLSSIFSYFYILFFSWIFAWFFLRYFKRSTSILISLASPPLLLIFAGLTLTSFSDSIWSVWLFDGVMGGRWRIDGNHLPLLREFGWNELIIGLNSEQISDSRGALGDSGLVTKLFIGGMFLVCLHFSFVWWVLLDVGRQHGQDGFFSLLLVVLATLTELGTNGFSMPTVTFYLLLGIYVCRSSERITGKKNPSRRLGVDLV